jgi:hypothetical protein
MAPAWLMPQTPLPGQTPNVSLGFLPDWDTHLVPAACPAGPALDPSKIGSFGLVLSRFEFNKMPNPAYK